MKLRQWGWLPAAAIMALPPAADALERTDLATTPDTVFTTAQPGTGNRMLTGPRLIQALAAIGYGANVCTPNCTITLVLANGDSYLAGRVLADGSPSGSQPAFSGAELQGATIRVQHADIRPGQAAPVVLGLNTVGVPPVVVRDMMANAQPPTPLPQSQPGAAVPLAAFKDYKVGSSAWTHTGGVHTVTNGSGSMSFLLGDNGQERVLQSAQYEARITISSTTDGDAGFVFRGRNISAVNDGYYGYYVGLKPGTGVVAGRVQRSSSGGYQWVELLTYRRDVQTGAAYTLRVENRGREIDVFVDGAQVMSLNDTTVDGARDLASYDSGYMRGAFGLRAFNNTNATYTGVSVRPYPETAPKVYDYSNLRSAVYTPARNVNYIDFWQTYDPVLVDRELSTAHAYGLNAISVYIHYLLWDNNKNDVLSKFDNLLQVADRNGIKVVPILYDDCWAANPALGDQGPPIYGRHNSRWVRSPGQPTLVAAYGGAGDAALKARLANYVSDFVSLYRNDPRIPLWQSVNEPGCSSGGDDRTSLRMLLNDTRIAWRKVGLATPMVAGAAGYGQDYVSNFFGDLFDIHPYGTDYPGPAGPNVVNTETLQRGQASNNYNQQTLPQIISHYGPAGMKTGWTIWDLMIGRTNTRWGWDNGTVPATSEPRVPFHGLAYQDGHPWSVGDVEAVKGVASTQLPVFKVEYYSGQFASLVKTSITPHLYLELLDEKGYASPDPQAGVPEKNYSVRWTGQVDVPATDAYTFIADSDNIARVWVNGALVINKTSAGGNAQATVPLQAGARVPIKVEYEHATGPALMSLKWSSPGMTNTRMLRLTPLGS